MAEALQSLIDDDVKLPRDLVPDDSEIYWADKGFAQEFEPYDWLATDTEQAKLYSNCALTYYNKLNDTNYKAVSVIGGKWCSHSECGADYQIIHHGFTAAETPDAQATFKNFFAVLVKCWIKNELVASSCCIVDGLKTVGCKDCCDIVMCEPTDLSWIKDFELSNARY